MREILASSNYLKLMFQGSETDACQLKLYQNSSPSAPPKKGRTDAREKRKARSKLRKSQKKKRQTNERKRKRRTRQPRGNKKARQTERGQTTRDESEGKTTRQRKNKETEKQRKTRQKKEPKPHLLRRSSAYAKAKHCSEGAKTQRWSHVSHSQVSPSDLSA